MTFALPNLVVGPLLSAVLAGYRIGETYGWRLGAASAYAVLALAQVVTLCWISIWDRCEARGRSKPGGAEEQHRTA